MRENLNHRACGFIGNLSDFHKWEFANTKLPFITQKLIAAYIRPRKKHLPADREQNAAGVGFAVL